MHKVAVLAYDTVVLVEMAMVVQAFESANLRAPRPVYDVGVAGPGGRLVTSSLPSPSVSIVVQHPLSWAVDADTVVIPAHQDFLAPAPAAFNEILLAAHARGARVASLCVGAFILASTGLLDGRSATTHWLWASEFRDTFPSVDLQPDRLFVGGEGLYTAAGVTASLDLALHLIEKDHGPALAASTARFLVAPMRRDGGQAQFVEYRTPGKNGSVSATIAWAEENLTRELTLTSLAQHAHMSNRTFLRRFSAQVGVSPTVWLLRTRIRRAKELLEQTSLPMDRVGEQSGFRSPSTFRHHFGRATGVTPGRYRRTFQTTVDD